MKKNKIMYGLIFFPLILTGIALLFLPDQVAIRYSSRGIQYGSKFALIIIPILGIWIGGFLVLIGKAMVGTPQEEIVRKITYVPLVIFNLVTIGALIGAFVIEEGKTNLKIMDIVLGSILGIAAVCMASYASFTARQKGPIISNTYLWMSESERANIDKKAEYRQLTVVFASLALMFAMLSIYIITSWKWAFAMMWILTVFVIVYAFVSSVRDQIKK